MRRFVAIVVLGLTALAAAVAVQAQQAAPAQGGAKLVPWAYAIVPAPPAPPAGAPAAAPPPVDPTVRTLPGSTLSFTLAQIRNGFGPADWFPGDHPVMPEIVAKGKQPDVRA